ncbi:MAG: zinc ABC transporter substrate-binding protein, partial [Clostridia bacterium]|nr:zinc ABC transporter substrate-binding protein [Clostridia bacterium]
MKRKTSILFCAICLIVLALLVCACESAPKESDGKVKIVTTIFPEYDFARQIAGDRADVTMLIDSGDLHSYEPTLSDITKISKCDLFVYIGGNSYSWVNSVLDKIKNENMTALNLFEHVDKLYESSDGIYQPDHE